MCRNLYFVQIVYFEMWTKSALLLVEHFYRDLILAFVLLIYCNFENALIFIRVCILLYFVACKILALVFCLVLDRMYIYSALGELRGTISICLLLWVFTLEVMLEMHRTWFHYFLQWITAIS